MASARNGETRRDRDPVLDEPEPTEVWKIVAGIVFFFAEPWLTLSAIAALFGLVWLIDTLGAVVGHALHLAG